jgi:hypothetical protein
MQERHRSRKPSFKQSLLASFHVDLEGKNFNESKKTKKMKKETETSSSLMAGGDLTVFAAGENTPVLSEGAFLRVSASSNAS